MKIGIFRTIKHLAFFAALLAAPAHGQTISPSENATPYASVRGWTVYSMSDGRGLFSCRAVRGQGYNDQIMIEYDGFDESWVLRVFGRRPPGGGLGIKGAAVYYDGRLADRQVGFGVSGGDGSSDSHATMIMTESDLRDIRKGNAMRMDINGEQSRTWSLSGTTAAILKVAECTGSLGFAPAGMAAAPVQQKPYPTAPTQQAPVDGFSVGYVVYPGGTFTHTGGGNWVEEGSNGSVFFFVEYNRTKEWVLMDDASRGIQIWIGLSNYEIRYTQNYDNNGWTFLYSIDCFDRQASRAC